MVKELEREHWRKEEVSYKLSNYADHIIQQLEDGGNVGLGDLSRLKEALRDFDIQMGFAYLCFDCQGIGLLPVCKSGGAIKCSKCNGRGIIQYNTLDDGQA